MKRKTRQLDESQGSSFGQLGQVKALYK